MKKKVFTVLAIAIAMTMAMCCLFGACGKKVADNTEHYDKITKTLKLSKSYDGKKLMSDDGIGAATMPGNTTDGDTSYFVLKEGVGITVRYQGVNTPESTAGVEKWGKAASIFTNECLQGAEVVLESASGGFPEKDSNATRYMCYVWYRKTATEDFKLLNLELVENGYSKNKESATSSYYSYFQKAENFARNIELRLFSKLDDPLFDTEVQQFSLKDFTEHTENYSENTKVELYAYVSDKYTASSQAVTLTIAQYDEETQKSYSIALYAGHTVSTGNMQVGDLYHILGTLQKYDGNWQISGVTVDNDMKGDMEWSWRSQASYYLIFDSSDPLVQRKESYNCYSDVTVTSATLTGSTLTFVGSAKEWGDGESYEYTFTVTVPDNYVEGTIAAGKTLSVAGCYQFEAGSNQITVLNYSKITIK